MFRGMYRFVNERMLIGRAAVVGAMMAAAPSKLRKTSIIPRLPWRQFTITRELRSP